MLIVGPLSILLKPTPGISSMLTLQYLWNYLWSKMPKRGGEDDQNDVVDVSPKKSKGEEDGELILRIVAAAVAVADRSGDIIREIMSKGDLGIVEKEVHARCGSGVERGHLLINMIVSIPF